MSENGKRLLFHAALPHHYVFFRPVYERLQEDDRLNWFWSSNFLGWRMKKHLFSLFDVKGTKISSLRARTRAYELLISPIYLNFDLAPRARLRVQIFHGCSLENCFLKPAINDYDVLFMVGPYMVRRCVEKGLLRPDDPRIRLIGMPKLDPLANGEIDVAPIRDELELAPNLPVVLYAPSGPGSSLFSQGLDLIQRLSEMPINLLVKLHDKTRDFRRNVGDWLWRVKKHQGKRVRILEGYEIVQYLALADVLITDFSSAAHEFLLRDRPIVFLPTPERRQLRIHQWDDEAYKIGVMVNSEQELVTAIEDAIAQPGRMSEVRRQALAEVLYNPGTATQRAAMEIYNLLELSPPTSLAAPVPVDSSLATR